MKTFVAIDLLATGRQIKRHMELNGYSIKDLMDYLYLKNPQAIYKWFRGECLPKIDVLFALSKLFEVSMEDLIVGKPITDINDSDSNTDKGESANE